MACSDYRICNCGVTASYKRGTPRYTCSDCAAQVKRAYYIAHRAEIIARARLWQRANPEKRRTQIAKSAAKNRARAKAWRLANPERFNANKRDARQRNPEQYRQYVRDWIARNPALNSIRKSEQAQRRRAQKFGAGFGIDLVNYAAVLERDGMICHICGLAIEAGATGSGKLNFDHVVPLAKGGQHSAENIKTSHFKCNRAKWDNLP